MFSVKYLLLVIAVAAVAACGQSRSTSDRSYGQGCDDPFAGESRLQFDPDGWETDFCRHSVPYEEIISGGPPRDGIPPIDDPEFVSVPAAGRWLNDREPVIALEIDGHARSYPLQILTWHEIVNDELAGTPIAVTFCPLCYAAVTFERPEVDGAVLTFGTTGNLRHSDLVMWDRQTESWWQQITGEAIVGRLTGMQLEVHPAQIISWAEFKRGYTHGEVLSRQTGFRRDYGRNPYVGYDDVDSKPFLYHGRVGEAMPPMARVVGVIKQDAGRAYALDDLKARKTINDEIAGTPVVVLWRRGTASAMDTRQIAGGRDVGSATVFERRANGRLLHFEPESDGFFTDRETGSTWNVLGEALDGPLEGTRLRAVPHHNIFWFVWSAFQPEGELYEPAD